MKKSLFILLLLISTNWLSAQEAPKHRLTLSALQHSTWTGVSYSRLYHPFENKSWEWGIGAGLATGFGGNSRLLGYNSIPLYTSLTYGTKHQIGFNLGYAYQFNFFNDVPFWIGNDIKEYTVFHDFHSFNYSLFYRYNFGKDNRYFLGIGGEFSHYLGEIVGQDLNLDPIARPFLNFGITF